MLDLKIIFRAAAQAVDTQAQINHLIPKTI